MKQSVGMFISILFLSFVVHAEESLKQRNTVSEEKIAVTSGIALTAAIAGIASIDENILDIIRIIRRLNIKELNNDISIFTKAHAACLAKKAELEQSERICRDKELCIVSEDLAKVVKGIPSDLDFMQEQRRNWEILLEWYEQGQEEEEDQIFA